MLQSGAPAIFIDGLSPGRPLLDTHLQSIELLRDPSHVRDYSLAEWTAALARAGFELHECRTWRLRMEFSTWVARMRTAQTHVEAIAPCSARRRARSWDYFAVEPDGSFMLDVLMLDTAAA